jgi:ubiquitin-protein ligase
MSVRLKRLYADFIRISHVFSGNPHIVVKSAVGKPPEKYELEFSVKGLEQKGKNILHREKHLAEIVLPIGYPREPPKCRMLTPIFHPNIAPHTICIGDHWVAGESLSDLIIRIGEMVCFQSYNIKSPLNGEAAKWAEENIARLPIDTVDLTLEKRSEDIIVTETDIEKLNQKGTQEQPAAPEIAITIPSPKEKEQVRREVSETPVVRPEAEESTAVCLNCKAEGPDVRFMKCNEGHIVCSDCIIECQTCGKTLCMLCSFGRCSICEKLLCNECLVTCPSCKKTVGKDHILKCDICSSELCAKCISICPACNGFFCKTHLHKTKNLCIKCAADQETKREMTIDKERENEPSPAGTAGTSYCKKCGRKIEDKNSLFCKACGYKLIEF